MMSLTDREEDYLRILYEIINEKGYAKVKDVAISLDITPSSVVGMMKKLSGKDLISYREYEGITLTGVGQMYAEAVSMRHKTFQELLQIIGVPKVIAEKDSHILEHHLHVITINRFSDLVKMMKTYRDTFDYNILKPEREKEIM
jgi:DtxR family Mn-dependent transcriptional regulator